MSNSRMLESSVRPKIFQQWPRRQDRQYIDMEPRDHKRIKPHQSLRAEQALQKSLFFIINIQTFLKVFNERKADCKKYEQNIKTLESNLQDMSQEKNKHFNSNQYRNQLRNYFITIRKGGILLRQLRTFGLCNLQNYNSKTTQMKFSRSDQEADQILQKKIQELKDKRRRVQETLVGYEYDIPQSVILGEQKQFQSCLHQLINSMQPDQLTDFHYLMQYKLRQLDQLLKYHESLMIASNQNYSRYQGLHDSLSLMQIQTKEMKKDRKHLKNKFDGLTIQNADELIPKSTVSLPLLTKNVKVYESNLQLLARYNAETDLKQYSNRRKNYTHQYTKFKSQFEQWKEEQRHAEYLYQRHQMLNSFQKKCEVSGKNTLQWQKKKLEQSYLECLAYKIPPKMSNVESYKFNLINQFEKVFRKQGIIVPKRQSLPLNKQKSIEYLKNSNKLQAFVDFFVRIKHKPYDQKINYLLENKEQIDAMDYQMKHQFDNLNIEEQKYSIGLKYSKAITSFLEDHKVIDRYLKQVEEYSLSRWQALPIGLQAVVFNFTKDVHLKKAALQYLDNIYAKQLKKYYQQMDIEINRVPNWADYIETSEIPYSANLSNTEERRQFFIKYARKVSKYSPMIRDQLIDEFWQRNQQAVRKCYQPVIKQIKSLGNIDKKNFFSFKILCYLDDEDRKLKVPNIKQLIHYYIGYVDRYDSFRWDQKHFFAEIIKQRILMSYLKNTLRKYMQISSEINVIQRINNSCVVLYQINDHLQMAKVDSLQAHISHSLSLEQFLIEEQRKKANKLIISDLKLAEKTEKVIKGMKKQPLIFGNRNKIDSYDKIVDINSKLDNLNHVSNYNQEKRRMQFLSEIYSTCQGLLNANKTISSENFQSSDIIAVRQNNKKMIYMDQISEKAHSELNDNFIQEIKIIETIYRGQNVESYSRFSRSQKDNTISNKVMQQIIRKIKELAIIDL